MSLSSPTQPPAGLPRKGVGRPPNRFARIATKVQRQRIQIRLLVVWFLILAGLTGLGIRLYILQVVKASEYGALARDQHHELVSPLLPRRPIVDQQGSLIAVDQRVYDVYAHPILFAASSEAIATQLSEVLPEQSRAALLRLFAERDSGIRISEALPRSVAQELLSLNIQGIDLEAKQQRYYPQGDLFAQIVGFVFFDERRDGQGGIELIYQDELQRTPGQFQLRRLQDGVLIPDSDSKGFQPQDDLRLQLTIDARLQQVAQGGLQRKLDEFEALKGAVIVMDVWSGALLTLATTPSYDPNRYFAADVESFRNWAVTDLYEPGSTFKPINLAIALDAGIIQAADQVYDEGQIQIDNWPISNHDFDQVGGRGALSISEVLQYSSNVGMVHIMEQLDPSQYHDKLTELGMAQALAIDLPSPATGYLKSRDIFEASPVDVATAAFGQGISISPLQMAQVLATLGNGGNLVTPHVVAGLVDGQNVTHWQAEQAPRKTVFSKATTETVLQFMEDVVTLGTGQVAAIDGYRIGGKTGTAQKAQDGIYLDDARITSFASIFPIESPRYLVFVVIDEPQGDDAYGSTVAAPLAKEVMNAMIGLYGIPQNQPDLATTEVQPPEPASSTDAGAAADNHSDHNSALDSDLDIPEG
ncbi:MAG: penicillin-binding protein 2 [Cyanobacteria bacterium P01_H01_bin.121]